MKKFTVLTEHYPVIEDMSDQDLGKLFRAMFEYHVNDNTVPPAEVRIPFRLFVIQFEKDKAISQSRSEVGRSGGKQIKAKRSKHKQTSNGNQSLTIEERKKKFKEQLALHLPNYGKDTLNQFYSYWSELNKSGKLMRFELEKTWELELRLNTWARRDKGFPSGAQQTTETIIPKV